jgi:hypothetical protein
MLPPSPPSSPDGASSEYKEAFALFDKKGTGAVPRDSLGDLLRALGQNPTQAEVAEIVASAPREGESGVGIRRTCPASPDRLLGQSTTRHSCLSSTALTASSPPELQVRLSVPPPNTHTISRIVF